MRAAFVIALALLASVAWAEPGTGSGYLAGQTVVEVRLEGASPAQLDALALLVQQEVGEPWDPRKVARSLELIFRLGTFDDARAEAVTTDDGVVLVVVVRPSPRLCGTRLSGLGPFTDGQVRAALSRAAGDPFVRGDEQRLAANVTGWYRARGYLEVVVSASLGTCPGRPGKRVELAVVPGPAYRIAELSLPTVGAGFSESRIRQLLGPKLRPGAVYREEALRQGLERLRDGYIDGGFVEFRFLSRRDRRPGELPVPVRVDEASKTVTIPLAVQAGPYVEPVFSFIGPRPTGLLERRLRQTIGLEDARRASLTYAEDAGRRLERLLQGRGNTFARVDVDVREEPYVRPAGVPARLAPQVETLRRLDFRLLPGPRVLLRRPDVTTEGNLFATDRQIARVLREASPKILGFRPPFVEVLGAPWGGPGHYTEEALNGALDVLRDWYRARGYLSARVEPRVELQQPRTALRPGTVRVHLVVDEGLRTTVESLAVNIALDGEVERDPDKRAALLAAWAESVGEWRDSVEARPLNPAAADALAQEVRTWLQGRGFLDAAVSARTELSDDGTLARLSLEGAPGGIVRIGQVIVRDNRRTHLGLIRREVGLEPGSLFDPTALREAQQKLLRSGLFERVEARPAQATGSVRDVELRVRERKRLHAEIGGGVSWPDDGPRVRGELRLRNLDGRGLTVFVQGRASLNWRFLTLGLTPVPEYRAAVGLQLPWIAGVPLRLSLTGVLNDEVDEPTFRLRRSSVGLTLTSRGLGPVRVGGRLELQGRSALRVDPAARLAPSWDTPTDTPFQDTKPLLLVGLTVTGDFRDDPLNPTRGVFAAATVDTTLGNFPTDSPGFGQATGRLQGLIPFGGGFGLKLEGGAGLSWSYTDELPPIDWRFRLGGSSTVRGYALDSLGPTGTRLSWLAEDGLLTSAQNDRTVSVGGTAFYRYSVEVLIPLGPKSPWRLALFHDAGNAALLGNNDAAIDDGTSVAWHPSAGLGIRRITPIGPLRLDVAVQPANVPKLGSVPLGDVVRVHFAIGAL